MRRYIERPLLIHQRKFHLRVYVLCVGSLKAYVYDQVLPYAMILAASFSTCISGSIFAQSWHPTQTVVAWAAHSASHQADTERCSLVVVFSLSQCDQ